MKSKIEYYSNRAIFIGLAFVLVLPSIAITLYSYPCQDDFHYAFYGRELMNEGHGLLYMALIKTVDYYKTFCGCYTSSFLGYFFSGIINCNLWGIRVFEFLSAIIFYTTLFIFIYTVADKVVKMERNKILPIYCLLLVCFNGLVNYSDHDDFYWFITSVQYLFICSLILLGVSFFILSFYATSIKKQRIFLGLACVLGFLGSGGTLSIAAFCCALYFLFFVWGFFVERSKKTALIGMVFTFLGAVINGVAPGNYIRDGQEISIGRLVHSVIQSFRYTLERWETFVKNPVFWIVMICLIVILLNSKIENLEKYTFKFPLVFIGFLFCLVAGIIFPTMLGYGYGCYVILNRGNFISDMAFYIFLFLALFYLKGWIQKKYSSISNIKINKDIICIVVVCVLGLLILDRFEFHNIPLVKGYRDWLSGECDKYEEYCVGIYNEIAASDEKVVEIHRDSVADITCMMNPQFYVGYYDYEKEYANQTIARFYGKDAVYLYLEDENK